MKLCDGIEEKAKDFQKARKNKENNRDKRGKDGWVKHKKEPFSDSAAC